MRSPSLLFAVMMLLGLPSCGRKAPSAAAPEVAAAASIQRRIFAPVVAGRQVVRGISYGPYRDGQRPGGPDPTAEQILEDLRIVSKRWGMIRMYGSRGPAETVLQVIRDHELPLTVMLGAWIAGGDDEANAAEVSTLIRLANTYPTQVFAVSVGNESQVSWSGHRAPLGTLIGHLRAVRVAVPQPVTTADDYNFWNKPESQAVAAEVDFLLLHAYAMWNGRTLDDAVPWTARIVGDIRARHPELLVVIGETGWATELDPDGSETEHIVAPAGPAEQLAFYEEFVPWAREDGLPHFIFEAFDEPWKGSDNPREVEKHWGLYDVHREPKPAVQAYDEVSP